MSAYRREFEETKMYVFLIKEDELLEKHNEIWEKVRNSIKKEFNSDPVYSENYLKAKIKSCNGKINTNFHILKVLNFAGTSFCDWKKITFYGYLISRFQ